MFESLLTGMIGHAANQGLDALLRKFEDSSQDDQKVLIYRTLFQDLRRLENLMNILSTHAVRKGKAKSGMNQLLSQLSLSSCESLETSGVNVASFLDSIQVKMSMEIETDEEDTESFTKQSPMGLLKSTSPDGTTQTEVILEGVLSEIYDKLLLRVHALRSIGIAQIGVDSGLRVDVRIRNTRRLVQELLRLLQHA